MHDFETRHRPLRYSSSIPSAWMYVAGLLIIFAGCGMSMGLTLWHLNDAVGSMERMAVPGGEEFTLEARSYTMFFEPHSATRNPGTLECMVVDDEDRPLNLRSPSMARTYATNPYRGESVLEFAIPTPGQYRIHCDSDDAVGAIAIGDGFSPLAMTAGVGGDIAAFLVGLGIIGYTRRRRRALLS